MIKREVHVYKTLDEFTSFLQNIPEGISQKRMQLPQRRNQPIIKTPAPAKIRQLVEAVKLHLTYQDVAIILQKFKNKVAISKNRKEDEQPIEKDDIRRVLLAINNRRMRAFIFMLASGGRRAVEGLAVRYKDIDFSTKPTKIYMRAKYSKNKLPREVYITDEASEQLKIWRKHKYGDDRMRLAKTKTLLKTYSFQ